MSAALKSYIPRPTPARSRRARKPVYQKQLKSSTSAVTLDLAPVLQPDQTPQPVPLPPQPTRTLQVLSNVQLVSAVLAASLVGLSLASYGVSVYLDRQLLQTTRRLNQLQRSEQQLTTVNEVLKSHMAQQADSSTTELIPPTPHHVIFLRPAQQRQQPVQDGSQSKGLSLPPVTMPMGY